MLSLHNNQLTGTITGNICARRDQSLAYTQLIKLTADCFLVECDCCTCYDENVQLVSFSPPSPTPIAFSLPTSSPNVITTSPTNSPLPPATNSPTKSRDVLEIKEQIENTVLQPNASFDGMDENDPRVLALDWILYKDQKQLEFDDNNLSQRYTLALMAFSLDSFAWFVCGNPGENYAESECVVNYWDGTTESFGTWLSSATECSWFGVTCSNDGIARAIE